MKTCRTAVYQAAMTTLLLTTITATLGCRNNNKPVIATQPSQPATPAVNAHPMSPSPAVEVSSSTAAPAQSGDSSSDAADHFAQGKKLIEDNCVECMGSNRSGLEQGVAEMQRAIDLGYQPAKDAYKLLENGYANLGTFTKDKGEQKSVDAKQKEIYQHLYDLDPRDPQILEDYAQRVATTNDEKLRVLQQAVEIDPKSARGQFLLSLSLIEKKDFPHGISALQQAVMNESDGESLMNEVRTLETLDRSGCSVPSVDQEHWNEEANSALSKSTFREGDPKAIPEFKERFLKFTNELSCPAQTATTSQ